MELSCREKNSSYATTAVCRSCPLGVWVASRVTGVKIIKEKWRIRGVIIRAATTVAMP